MLTPAFDLTQDENFLRILIRAPYAKVSETEIFVEENDFKFFSKPYFLRLNLPGNIVEDGQEKAEYNAEKGEFRLSFAKQTPGEHFEGLDMITKLLAPKGSKSASQPLIEVIAESPAEHVEKSEEDTCTDNPDVDVADEDFDWSIDQTPYVEDTVIVGGAKYGFANQKSGVFQRLQEELCGVVDCPDPDNMVPVQRREARLASEDAKFDPEHYLGDFLDDEIVQTLIKFNTRWLEQIKEVEKGITHAKEVQFTEEEKETMRKLPNKEYLLDQDEEKAVYLGLVDILYAYAYNYRISEGESNVESGWNISKLSATLSWFEVYPSLQDVLVTCYRRCLCYPLYRNWLLCAKVLEDVKYIFRLGRQYILKCLLDVRRLLMDTDSRYIFSDLYITDYCVWIQHTSSSKLQSLSETLQKIEIAKEEVGFNLAELEQLAASAVADNEVDSVTDKLCDLNVEQSKVSDSDDNDDDDTESDTTDSDDSSYSDELPESEKDQNGEVIENSEGTPKVLVADLTGQDKTLVNPKEWYWDQHF